MSSNSSDRSKKRPSAHLTRDNVKIDKTETVFQGFFQILRHHIRHTRFDGEETPEFTREVFERGHAVALIPYDPVTDRVVLIEQFRVSAATTGDHPWMIEIPAGIIEKGETPLHVARRELLEETGMTATILHQVFRVYTTPGGSSETATYFYAEIDSSTAKGFHGLDHEQEDIAVFTLPLDEALSWIEDGNICNAFAVTALQWLALNREKLQQTVKR